MWRPGSKAIIFRRARRSRSRYSAPRARSKMSVPGRPRHALELLRAAFRVVCGVRSPNWCGRRRIRGAARRGADWRAMRCCSRPSVRAIVVALMFGLDAREIQLMPPRGSAEALAGSHPDRLRKGGFRAVVPGRTVVCGGGRRAALAGRLAVPAARSRDAFAVCVAGRAGAAARRRDHQMDRRARPAVRRRRSQCLQLRAFRGNPGLCQFSIGACHHQRCAGLRGFGGVASGDGFR